MAERVYPLLYFFENSVRDLIELVLADKHGSDWWETVVPAKVREAAADIKAKEQKDTWHSKRGRRPVDYLLLTQLWKIIHARWKDFEPLFPQGQAWVQSMIENDMNVSRAVFAHMNPLEEDDIKNLEASFRKWIKHLSVIAGKLPNPSVVTRRASRARTHGPAVALLLTTQARLEVVGRALASHALGTCA
jgi:hypothetical protein